jgi:hypothetical protein
LDQRAYGAERRLGAAADGSRARSAFEQARVMELRADADRLFADAMREINDEVRAAIRSRTSAAGRRSLSREA